VVEAHNEKSQNGRRFILVGRDGPQGSCGKKTLNCQIFIGGKCAVGGEKAPECSNVFNEVQSFSSGKETAQVVVHAWYCNTPKNGSMKLSGNFQADCSAV
jgi:hypothetical protein